MTVSYDLWDVFGPANWTTLATVMAMICQIRQNSVWACRWLAIGCLWFISIGVLPLGLLAMQPLEDRYPVIINSGHYDGIIMLTGGEKLSISARSRQPEFGDTSERATSALGLLMNNPKAKLIVAGGIKSPEGVRDIDVIGQLARELHAPIDRIQFVGGTFTTWENARATAHWVKPGERWLLVTSAFHMPRAMLCFEALGAHPVPYPVDHRVWPYHTVFDMFSLGADANIKRVDYALHEWAGLVSYKFHGYTKKLWP